MATRRCEPPYRWRLAGGPGPHQGQDLHHADVLGYVLPAGGLPGRVEADSRRRVPADSHDRWAPRPLWRRFPRDQSTRQAPERVARHTRLTAPRDASRGCVGYFGVALIFSMALL